MKSAVFGLLLLALGCAASPQALAPISDYTAEMLTADATLAERVYLTEVARYADFRLRNPTFGNLLMDVPRQDQAVPIPEARELGKRVVLPGFSPAQIKAAYNLPTSNTAGAGKTIAVTAAYKNANAEANLLKFTRQWGLPDCTTANSCFKQVFVCSDGTTGSICVSDNDDDVNKARWNNENDMDIQWAYAMAPGAKIISVHVDKAVDGHLIPAVIWAKTHAHHVSNSWGRGENIFDYDDSSFEAPSGVSILFSTGDNGSSEFQYPSSSRRVVAVGGTSLVSGTPPSETVWSGTGGGCSKNFDATDAQLPFSKVACDTKRATPDISMVSDPNTGVSIFSGGMWRGLFGGTSLGAPILAGAAAAWGVKLNAATIYGDKFLFRDVTSGSNGAFSAGNGFDVPSGRGSFIGLDCSKASIVCPDLGCPKHLQIGPIQQGTCCPNTCVPIKCGASKKCPSGSYCNTCDLNLGTCQAGNDCATGSPQVCSCDGLTYANECSMAVVGGGFQHSGVCHTPCLDASGIVRLPGDVWSDMPCRSSTCRGSDGAVINTDPVCPAFPCPATFSSYSTNGGTCCHNACRVTRLQTSIVLLPITTVTLPTLGSLPSLTGTPVSSGIFRVRDDGGNAATDNQQQDNIATAASSGTGAGFAPLQ